MHCACICVKGPDLINLIYSNLNFHVGATIQSCIEVCYNNHPSASTINGTSRSSLQCMVLLVESKMNRNIENALVTPRSSAWESEKR